MSTGKQAGVTVKNHPYLGIVFLNKKSSKGAWDAVSYTHLYRTSCSMAETGKKVLMIDTDIRKSVLVNRLGIDKPGKGLSEYLSGQCLSLIHIFKRSRQWS